MPYYYDSESPLFSGQESIKYVTNHGEYTLGDGKSLCMVANNFCDHCGGPPIDYQRDSVYGPGHMSMFSGTSGDDTSGYTEIYIFYRLKFRFEEYSLTGGNFQWTKSKEGVDEYYLDTGSPGHLCANTITINGERIGHGRIWPIKLANSDAIDLGNNIVRLTVQRLSAERASLFWTGDVLTINGTVNYDGTYTIKKVSGDGGTYIDIEHAFIPERFSGQEKIGVFLGHLGHDTWCYGDNDNLGYYTIYIRLSGDTEAARNPNNKPDGYIKYEAGFFSFYKKDPPEYWYGCNHKHLQLASGFWNHHWWHADNGDNGCLEQNKHAYGCNFVIFNWTSGSGGIGLIDSSFVGTGGDQSCYNYTQAMTAKGGIIDARNWGLKEGGFDASGWYIGKKWFGMEYRFKIGTKDNYDGETEVWIYDESGNIVFHKNRIQENHLKVFPDHKYNRIIFGGNRVNSSYCCLHDDSWDNRYYLDDVIIDDQRIGPTYFALLKEQQAVKPVDINNDSQVNVLDLQLCVNVVLGIETDADRVKRANVNGDGSVDVLDIQKIINVILGG